MSRHSPILPSPPSHSHPFLQPCFNPTPSPEGSIRIKDTTYYTNRRSPSDHHVSIYDCDSATPLTVLFPTVHNGEAQPRPASIVSASGSVSPSVVALTARQRPPSAPPRSVRGATGDRIVGGIQRTPLSELGILEGVTPAMEVAAAAAPLVAPARKQREESSIHAFSVKSDKAVSMRQPPPRWEWNEKRPDPQPRRNNAKERPHTPFPVDARPPHYIQSKKSHHRVPKEIIRIQRDRTSGNVCQFNGLLPSELENRMSPAAFAFFVQAINVHLRDAYSVSGVIVDNVIAVATLWTSSCWRASHFEKELRRVEELIAQANKQTFNPKRLNVLSPRGTSFQYLEIEYY